MTSPWQPNAADPSAEPASPPAPPVVSATSAASAAPPAPKRSKPGAPKWEAHVKDRLRHAIRKLSKPLEELVSRDANEGDTRHLVTDLLVDGLGYDKYEDLTTEYQVKVDFADYGVRIDKQLVAFVEVKRCTQKLNEKHLRQVQMYAVNEGVEWMMLTNGQVWQAYHLTGGLPVIVDMALEVDLLAEVPLGDKVGGLFFLTKESLSPGTDGARRGDIARRGGRDVRGESSFGSPSVGVAVPGDRWASLRRVSQTRRRITR